MTVTIYHNPQCSNSRKALEIIRSHGIEPKIVEYLKTPPTPQGLRHLIREKLKVPVVAVMRTQEAAYAEMKLDGADDDTLFAAIAAHPNWFKPHWTLAQVLRFESRREEAEREGALALDLDGGKHPEVARSLAR